MTKRQVRLERSGPWIGVVGMVMVLWFAISTVLYAPWWGVLLNIALIVPEAMVLARLARTRPVWCIAVPVVGTAVFVLLSFLGARYWGWDA